VAEVGTRGSAEPTRRIGRYVVLNLLGHGGQGEVYLVVHPELGVEFVLKLSKRSKGAEPTDRERLLREGRVLAGCDHPCLVRVIDLDDDDGRPFIVMEHVHGVNLEQRMEKRRPGPRAAARLIAQLAGAVAYLDARGIIHQDIKPTNVLIDVNGRPRLIDFGLARLRHAWAEDAPGSSGGTTSYMSPEQAMGSEGRIGTWTDVFGLGGVLYYLLTGLPVYQGASSLDALQKARKAEQVAPRQIDRKVPRSLERICLKALAPDPDQRYQTAEDLERALRGFLAGPRIAATGVAALVMASLAFAIVWPRATSTGQSASGQTAGGHAAASSHTREATPRIVSFEVTHFRGDNPPVSLGTIGESPGPIRFDDDVRLHARLDVPAYCYLMALNPDGKVQLCHPSAGTEPPPRSNELGYPRGDLYFPLTDGVGLQAFVLLASRAPLPPYSQWEGKVGLHWEAVPADGAALWSFDGQTFELLAKDRRSEPRRRTGEPRPFRAVCEYIATRPDVDAVSALAFPVEPVGPSE